MARLNTPRQIIPPSSLSFPRPWSHLFQKLCILHEALCILQEAPVETTKNFKSSSEKNQRAKNCLEDLWTSLPPSILPTLHSILAPLHFHSPLSSLHRKHRNSVSFVLKKMMKNKIAASLTCFLPSAYQLLFLFFQNIPQISLQSLLKPQPEILEGEAIRGNPAGFL